MDECVERYPEMATYLGVAGHDHEWSDYSPAGHAEQMAHIRRTIAALHTADPVDDRETTAKEAMLERLGLEVELYEAHITAVPGQCDRRAGAGDPVHLRPDADRRPRGLARRSPTRLRTVDRRWPASATR